MCLVECAGRYSIHWVFWWEGTWIVTFRFPIWLLRSLHPDLSAFLSDTSLAQSGTVFGGGNYDLHPRGIAERHRATYPSNTHITVPALLVSTFAGGRFCANKTLEFVGTRQIKGLVDVCLIYDWNTGVLLTIICSCQYRLFGSVLLAVYQIATSLTLSLTSNLTFCKRNLVCWLLNCSLKCCLDSSWIFPCCDSLCRGNSQNAVWNKSCAFHSHSQSLSCSETFWRSSSEFAICCAVFCSKTCDTSGQIYQAWLTSSAHP